MEQILEIVETGSFIHDQHNYTIINNRVFDDQGRCAILISRSHTRYLWSSLPVWDNPSEEDRLFYPPIIVALILKYDLKSMIYRDNKGNLRLTNDAITLCGALLEVLLPQRNDNYAPELLWSFADLHIVWIPPNQIFRVIASTRVAEELIYFRPNDWSYNNENGVYRITTDEEGEEIIENFRLHEWFQN